MLCGSERFLTLSGDDMIISTPTVSVIAHSLDCVEPCHSDCDTVSVRRSISQILLLFVFPNYTGFIALYRFHAQSSRGLLCFSKSFSGDVADTNESHHHHHHHHHHHVVVGARAPWAGTAKLLLFYIKHLEF